MAIKQNKNELHLYPVNDDEYIGAIDLDDMGSVSTHARTVVLLDSSKCMGDATSRFVKEVLPLVMSKLNYPADYSIELINFGSTPVGHNVLTATQLKSSALVSDGNTGRVIYPLIRKLHSTLERMQRDNPDTPVRVLTIMMCYDGNDVSISSASPEKRNLIDFVAKSGLTINSLAVRLFTSDNQSGLSVEKAEEALSYVLQINNTTEANICDIKTSESNEKIADEIAALFRSDSFDRYQTLQFEESIISKFHWESFQFQSSRIVLVPGRNIFWFKRVPSGSVKLAGGDVIKVVNKGQLGLDMFQQLMATKLDYILNHLIILRVVHASNADKIVKENSSYFEKTEEAIAVKCSAQNNKIITNLLNGIASSGGAKFRDFSNMAPLLRDTKQQIENQRKEAEREEAERLEREKAEEAKRETEDTDSIQTVFILDEHASGAKDSQRLTEQIVPLTLLRLFHESSQHVHVVTFIRHRTTVDEILQSLSKTLDAMRRIQILVLTNGHAEERQDVERFADMLVEFLTGRKYSFELNLVRLASSGVVSKNYKLVDIEANKSNEIIAKQIAGSSDLQVKDCEGKLGILSFQFIIFVIIFVLLTIRYIYSFSKDN